VAGPVEDADAERGGAPGASTVYRRVGTGPLTWEFDERERAAMSFGGVFGHYIRGTSI
jgi:hypothetical protein